MTTTQIIFFVLSILGFVLISSFLFFTVITIRAHSKPFWVKQNLLAALAAQILNIFLFGLTIPAFITIVIPFFDSYDNDILLGTGIASLMIFIFVGMIAISFLGHFLYFLFNYIFADKKTFLRLKNIDKEKIKNKNPEEIKFHTLRFYAAFNKTKLNPIGNLDLESSLNKLKFLSRFHKEFFIILWATYLAHNKWFNTIENKEELKLSCEEKFYFSLKAAINFLEKEKQYNIKNFLKYIEKK
ncbi:hypothetical protein [Mycoplasmopsis columbina]|uniref:hypothetical protein n=1 Tax=Mycoplasmopsis columbina TaxID=114881 RepID=UPI0004A71051|nr:hypothetical protein [Mycoplasmopsis columbina]VEU76648.1 Uncharacterised protein [Mycoplasmopsis columbina]